MFVPILLRRIPIAGSRKGLLELYKSKLSDTQYGLKEFYKSELSDTHIDLVSIPNVLNVLGRSVLR